MPKTPPSQRPKAQLPHGLQDRTGALWRKERALIERLLPLYEAHGFMPLATPALEYSRALGQFLPDAERPNKAVFALQDEDAQWLSLRYDLTAPFARYVAANYDNLPKPFRRCQYGAVWRNEKPGPGRLREFAQLDADIAASSELAADAELCLLASQAMQVLGAPHSVRINHRRLLDGVLAELGWDEAAPDYPARRLVVLRAIDKLERLGAEAVKALLGKGRTDASGDVTQGAGLSAAQIAQVMAFLNLRGAESHHKFLQQLEAHPLRHPAWQEGCAALAELAEFFAHSQTKTEALSFDCAIVRGLDYYTGPVFELELGDNTHKMGAVGGGGRYDGLIGRLRAGDPVPATGFSLGITRLALLLDDAQDAEKPPLILVAVMEKGTEPRARAFALAQELRAAGLPSEAYVGSGGLKAQLRYADKRGIAWVILEGADERQSASVTLKDMQKGKAQSAAIASNQQWRESAHAQQRIKRRELVQFMKSLQKQK